MTILNINGHSVQVDIAAELSEYNFDNARWNADKLIASSPFRDDRAPSFFVNLSGEYAGTFADSGALDYDHARGGFVKLIGLLRGTSYEEAGDYLIEKYGTLYAIKPDEPIRIAKPKIARKEVVKPIENNPIIEATSPYLITRGIGADVQALYGVGYDEGVRGHTAIPWRTPTGSLANILYRSTRGKMFHYYEGGAPIKRLLFGMDIVEETAVIVEGVIDAMSWEMAGISAIAVGGAHISREQIDLIKRSRIRRLYLGGDNDEQGRKLNRQVAGALRGYVELYTVDYGTEKDANDVLLRKGLVKLGKAIECGNRLHSLRINVL